MFRSSQHARQRQFLCVSFLLLLLLFLCCFTLCHFSSSFFFLLLRRLLLVLNCITPSPSRLMTTATYTRALNSSRARTAAVIIQGFVLLLLHTKNNTEQNKKKKQTYRTWTLLLLLFCYLIKLMMRTSDTEFRRVYLEYNARRRIEGRIDKANECSCRFYLKNLILLLLLNIFPFFLVISEK